MKKIVITGELGHVVVASYKAEGKVSVVSMQPMFKLGEKNSTIPNVMHSLASTLMRLAEGEELVTIAVNDFVAGKINSDILVREFWAQETMANKRALSAPELGVYDSLIKAIGATYGKVVVKSEKHITKTVRDGLTQEQLEWANLHSSCRTILKQKVAPAPELAVVEVSSQAPAGEPSDNDIAI